MNCSHAERLLPLYARVDLDRSSHTAVAAHLESCEHCRQLADEYKNIQGWIRLHEPPEFNEEFFAGIRQNVLREIGQRPVDSSTLSTWLRKLVAPQTAFATATAALLIICGAIGLFVFREHKGTAELTARSEMLKSEPQKGAGVNANPVTLPTEDQSQSRQAAKNGSGSRVALNGPSGNNGNRVRRRIARTTPAPLPTHDTLASATGSSGARSVDSGLSRGQAPLRVEIQTQNPDVRIIWFAPNAKQSSVTN